ncbi:MAG: TIM-barrel domain-containing protein [Faecousia sp.]
MRYDQSAYRPSETAIIRGETYRFTVLTPALIRMEYSETGSFVDCLTQTVMNRNFPVPSFHVEETSDDLEIITDYLRLKYNKKEFSSAGLQIHVNSQQYSHSALWHYGDEPCDLLGTARTLDEADGSIPLEHGVLSAAAWSLLDDSGALLLNDAGWVEQRTDRNAKDLYFFGYGWEYLRCLKDFYHLTGHTPLLPRYALGNWWSRYYKYSEKSYLELMNRFQAENIPFSVAVIDMDWHITQVEPQYGSGWTGYTWNRDLFPDPKRFMDDLHRRKMKVTLNVHPADGVRAYEDCYPALAEYMGIDGEKGTPVPFEPGNPKFVKGYFDYVHHPLEEQGVDFWWIDWQQGYTSDMEGLDPLWMLNHCHYLDNCRNNNRGLIFSRYAGPGSHRYPIGFSGDTIISWASLQFQPFFTANASNIGYAWWSHDIGGHMNGVKDDELAVRWLQFGVFSPIMRLHSTCNEFNGKEPWRYNMIAEKVMKDFLRLRHRLIPYLYTMNLRTHREDVPLVQPMYYHNPSRYEAYQVPNEYYFGTEMIVCPITQPMDKESQLAKFTAWLPEGMWIDLFTGLIYEGNRTHNFYRGIEQIPVMAKCGSIIPLDGREEGNNTDNPDYLELYVCAGGQGAFSLWEDDGYGVDFHGDHWAETKLSFEPGETSVLTIQKASGNTAVLPETRRWRLRLFGAGEGVVPTVYAEGAEINGVSCFYDRKSRTTVVDIPPVSICQTITVGLSNTFLHKNQKTERIFEFLNRAEMSFHLKDAIYRIIQQADNGENVVYAISQLQGMGLRDAIIGPIMEVLVAYAYE